MAGSLDYRLYLLNGEGRIVRAEVVECASEAEAVEVARDRARRGPYSTELWFRSRRIGYYPRGGRPPTSRSSDASRS